VTTPALPPTRPERHELELALRWQRGERPDVWIYLAEVGPLAPDQGAAVLAVDQQERWLVGERVAAEVYLEKCPELRASPEAALELVYGEFALRERLGERPDPDEYARRFPELAERLGEQLQLRRALDALTAEPSAPGGPVGAGAGESRRSRWPVVPDHEVRGELGRGATGAVYLAHQESLRRLVALKVLRAEATDAARTRFRTASEAVARLRHPNVIRIFAVGTTAAGPYFTMEFAGGDSLKARLDGGPWPLRDAVALVRTLAGAVQYAHEHGIIHSNLKPSNVLLQTTHGDSAGAGSEPGSHRPDPHGWLTVVPRIADFGVAEVFAGAGHGSPGVGPPGIPCYLAPEQLAGRCVGPPADVYALGAILYELLTGCPPVRATAADAGLTVRLTEPVPPSRLRHGVPRDLETVCLKCLEKDPGKRYPSAAELAADLGRVGTGEPILARPVGWVERFRRWCRRNRIEVALVTVCAISVEWSVAAPLCSKQFVSSGVGWNQDLFGETQ
jgi:serine/threonine-protein kinase